MSLSVQIMHGARGYHPRARVESCYLGRYAISKDPAERPGRRHVSAVYDVSFSAWNISLMRCDL